MRPRTTRVRRARAGFDSVSLHRVAWLLLLTVAWLATPAPGAAQEAPQPKPPAGAAPKKPPATKPKGRTTADLARALEVERKRVEAQKARIDSLEAQDRRQSAEIERLEAALLDLQNELRALQQLAPQESLTVLLEARLQKLEASAERIPEVSEVVSAGNFPGSIRVPGTDAAFKLGGKVRLLLVANLDALGVDDRFATWAIPIAGTVEAQKGSRLTMSVRASRLNFETRSPTPVGDARAFMEADFAGSGTTFRLRHAFVQWHEVLLGQTWSTFSDPEAEPDGIDFEGLNAISLFRRPQFRWTRQPRDDVRTAAAIEDPRISITGASSVSQVPDVVVRFRWQPERGHVQTAVIGRQIRGEIPFRPNEVTSAAGYGLEASGSLAVRQAEGAEGDRVKFSLYAGRGIGSLISDLDAEGGQDGVLDTTAVRVEVLPVLAGYVGYEHWWRRGLRSTATFGAVRVDNIEIQPPDAYRSTYRTSFNLAWSPIGQLDLVTEFLWGQRMNKDKSRGRASQIQLGAQLIF